VLVTGIADHLGEFLFPVGTTNLAHEFPILAEIDEISMEAHLVDFGSGTDLCPRSGIYRSAFDHIDPLQSRNGGVGFKRAHGRKRMLGRVTRRLRRLM